MNPLPGGIPLNRIPELFAVAAEHFVQLRRVTFAAVAASAYTAHLTGILDGQAELVHPFLKLFVAESENQRKRIEFCLLAALNS